MKQSLVTMACLAAALSTPIEADAQDEPNAETTARYLISRCFTNSGWYAFDGAYLTQTCPEELWGCKEVKVKDIDLGSVKITSSERNSWIDVIRGSCWSGRCVRQKSNDYDFEELGHFEFSLHEDAIKDRCLKAFKHLIKVSGGQGEFDPFE